MFSIRTSRSVRVQNQESALDTLLEMRALREELIKDYQDQKIDLATKRYDETGRNWNVLHVIASSKNPASTVYQEIMLALTVTQLASLVKEKDKKGKDPYAVARLCAPLVKNTTVFNLLVGQVLLAKLSPVASAAASTKSSAPTKAKELPSVSKLVFPSGLGAQRAFAGGGAGVPAGTSLGRSAVAAAPQTERKAIIPEARNAPAVGAGTPAGTTLARSAVGAAPPQTERTNNPAELQSRAGSLTARVATQQRQRRPSFHVAVTQADLIKNTQRSQAVPAGSVFQFQLPKIS